MTQIRSKIAGTASSARWVRISDVQPPFEKRLLCLRICLKMVQVDGMAYCSDDFAATNQGVVPTNVPCLMPKGLLLGSRARCIRPRHGGVTRRHVLRLSCLRREMFWTQVARWPVSNTAT